MKDYRTNRYNPVRRLPTRLVPVLMLLAIGSVFAPLRQAQGGPAADPTNPPIVPRGALSDVERSTIDIFARYSPGVVTVINKALLKDFFSMTFYENIRGSGSGFIWNKQGHIVSNFHVVDAASAIQVILKDGTRYDAAIVGLDPDHDLAVLKIDAPPKSLTPIPLGTSRNLKVGQRVMAIGHPFGFDTSLSVGIISSLDREMRSPTRLMIRDIIQTDAAINFGNSGGPLLDSSGRLVGVNTSIVSPNAGSVGLGFALPVDIVTRIVPQLIAHGRAQRVGLGVILSRDRLAQYRGLRGALIRHVVPRSAAQRAGLRGERDYQWGDVIVQIDDKAIRRGTDLRDVLDGYTKNTEVTVGFMRDGKRRETTLTLQELND